MLNACCSKCEKETCVASNTNNTQMIITAKVKIKPERVIDFIEGTKELIAQSRAEEGNITYTLYQDPSDLTQFIFVEEWKDQAAIDFHFNTPHFKNFGAFSNECASGPSQIKIFDAKAKN